MTDPVNHPEHYTGHPAGVECIDVIEWLPLNVGNAIKYLWRVDRKGPPLEDLRKAAWYVAREIRRRFGHGAVVTDAAAMLMDHCLADLSDDDLDALMTRLVAARVGRSQVQWTVARDVSAPGLDLRGYDTASLVEEILRRGPDHITSISQLCSLQTLVREAEELHMRAADAAPNL